MSHMRFTRLPFKHGPRTSQLLFAGAATVTITATALYTSPRSIEAEELTKQTPTFGSFGFPKLVLESVEQMNHDTKRFRFALPKGDNSVSGLKLTSALLSMSWPKGDWTPVVRPYTPASDLNDPGHIDLVIKRYPNGRQSSHIHSLKPGDSLTFFGFPLPGYKWSENKHDHVLLIAGGAGITPIYQLVQGILNNPHEQTKVTLVWGTNTDEDVFLHGEFDELESRFSGRFAAYYTVSRPKPDSKYRRGHVSREFLQDVMEKQRFNVKKGGMAFLCGPPAMEKAMTEKKDGVLTSLGITADKVHRF